MKLRKHHQKTIEADNEDIEAEPPEEVPTETADTNETEDTDVLSQRYLARLADDGTQIITGDPSGVHTAAQTTNLQALTSGQAHWSLYMAAGALTALAAIYMIRHAHAFRQLVVQGEHYVGGHPFLEAVLVYGALWVLLFASYGAVL